MSFANVYEDETRAESYATLTFPGTYHLAYRDLPQIIAKYTKGIKALDFGCGTGRSSRFVRDLGFDVTGIDISESMLKKAREVDHEGKYILVPDGELRSLWACKFDLITSIFTFDNINPRENKLFLFRKLGNLLNKDGIFINLVSSPKIYTHEWVSFSTKDFPENKEAKSGDEVKIIITDVPDKRPVTDIVCSDDEYRKFYREADLEVVDMLETLGKEDEGIQWVNETKISPWVIYVLKPSVKI